MVLGRHRARLQDPMLLGQILLCEALRWRSIPSPLKCNIYFKTQEIGGYTVESEVESDSFFPNSLLIHSSCWLPPEVITPGTTRGMLVDEVANR